MTTGEATMRELGAVCAPSEGRAAKPKKAEHGRDVAEMWLV